MGDQQSMNTEHHEHVSSFWGRHEHDPGDFHIHPPGATMAARAGIHIEIERIGSVREVLYAMGFLATMRTSSDRAKVQTEAAPGPPPEAVLPVFVAQWVYDQACVAMEVQFTEWLNEQGVSPVGITAVESSNIEAIGWRGYTDDGTGVLMVAFHSGGIYEYDAVPESVFAGFVQAPSLGRFFHHQIKDQYAYQKVAPEAQGWPGPQEPI